MDLEHPSITRTMKTGYPVKKLPVTVCANESCEAPIYPGQHVWHKGSDRYCNLKCMHESMYETK
ncbi:hypothetical protein A8F94_17365 [Bacillus sp. FJAT-27225]|nr:hypothetical protein A8F94_17365 [Bacillus sp. FJAT-27225]